MSDLETWARRIRGEIFFARQWLLVEGQCEYLLLHSSADAMGCNLDRNGTAVIDFQNNGAPAPFAALARALNIPWFALVDGDAQGKQFVDAIRARRFSEDTIRKSVFQFAENNIEEALIAAGLEPELRAILKNLGVIKAESVGRGHLLKLIANRKSQCALALAKQLKDCSTLVDRMPKVLHTIIASVGTRN